MICLFFSSKDSLVFLNSSSSKLRRCFLCWISIFSRWLFSFSLASSSFFRSYSSTSSFSWRLNLIYSSCYLLRFLPSTSSIFLRSLSCWNRNLALSSFSSCSSLPIFSSCSFTVVSLFSRNDYLL